MVQVSEPLLEDAVPGVPLLYNTQTQTHIQAKLSLTGCSQIMQRVNTYDEDKYRAEEKWSRGARRTVSNRRDAVTS